MRIFAVSDVHIDYKENRRWLENLFKHDYTHDMLILAGDVTDNILLLGRVFADLRKQFSEVAFVPGNHELWVHRGSGMDSFEKFHYVKSLAADHEIRTDSFHLGFLSVIPLYGWYGYTFGHPVPETMRTWADYSACKWPDDFNEKRITDYFIGMNRPSLDAMRKKVVISFPHVVQRIDLMSSFIPPDRQRLYPVFGSLLLEEQIRQIDSNIHVYGHSHVNRNILIYGTLYINNAFGYPYETWIATKELKCIYEQ